MQVLSLTSEVVFQFHPTSKATAAAATKPHFHLFLISPKVFSINSDIPSPTPFGSLELGDDEKGKRGPQLSLPFGTFGLEAVDRRRPLFDVSSAGGWEWD
jgi:hypothetical protein